MNTREMTLDETRRMAANFPRSDLTNRASFPFPSSAAAEAIRRMHGANRIPTLLQRVDRLTKQPGATA